MRPPRDVRVTDALFALGLRLESHRLLVHAVVRDPGRAFRLRDLAVEKFGAGQRRAALRLWVVISASLHASAPAHRNAGEFGALREDASIALGNWRDVASVPELQALEREYERKDYFDQNYGFGADADGACEALREALARRREAVRAEVLRGERRSSATSLR